MQYYLGIDAGGTKTAAIILNAHKEVLGEGIGGSGNIATNTDTLLTKALSTAVQGAMEQAGMSLTGAAFTAVCAGVAGYSLEIRRRAFEVVLTTGVNAHHYAVQPDYIVSYWGATHGEPGIVVIAGTGAVAYGRNERGETYKEDGFGYLLGDKGSAFNLGIYALRHTLNRIKNGETDRITQAVIAQTGVRMENELLQWLYSEFSPARVATLAPLIGRLAEEGDPAARGLVTEMARRLRHTARVVRHKLWLPRTVPIYPMGGLWHLGEFLRSEFIEPQWKGETGTEVTPEPLSGGRFYIATPKDSPAYGAALLAMAYASSES